MRSPSGKVLINSCDVYHSPGSRGPDGGAQFPYPLVPTYSNVPCTIQGRAVEVVDEQGRITQLTGFVLIFASFIAITPRDQITFTDNTGTFRTLIVESIEDMAGRGAAFKTYCTERL